MTRLEDRTTPNVVNGDFSVADPASPQFGWTVAGTVAVTDGRGVIRENGAVNSGLAQTFTLPAGATALRFSVVRAGFVANPTGNPPDAFEAALLDPTTQASLLGPITGLANTDAFLNVQQNGQVFFAPGVTVSGVSTSGDVADLSVPLLVTVELTSLPAAASVRLAYDLLGFAATTSAVEIDDVIVAAGPQPPPLAFVLAAASDTGTVGDDLTAANPVSLVATTDPNQLVELDTDGDGFDDGTVTSDGTGRAVFSGVTLTAGANAVRMRATNAAGTATANRTITLDPTPPTGQLTSPTAGGTVATDPGFVDIQWTDVGAAGLDAATFGLTDITITGVDIDRFEDRGGGVVRYFYADDGDRLTAGGVIVTLAAGQVGDRAGNTNPEGTFGFTLTDNRPPVAVADSYTVSATPFVVPAATGVLANDTDADNNPLTAVLVTGPASGTLNLATGGGFTYTPNAGFSGTDSFTYRASDGTATSDAVQVTLTVPPSPPVANRPPVAVADAYPVAVSPLTVPAGAGVLANDTDPDANPMRAVLVTGPANGTLTLRPDGGFTYTPTAGFTGADGFTYRATDGTLDSAAVRVTLTVPAPPSPPPETVPPSPVAPISQVLTADGCLTLPGTAGQQIALRFLWEFREARFHNEVGVYRATGAGGAVNGVLPGQAGYAQAVLSAGRPQVLFTSGSRAGAFRDLTFDANDTLCFYVVQNNTSDAARAGRANVFFLFPQANPDGQSHARVTSAFRGITEYAWEDQTIRKHWDFDDVVFRVTTVPTPPVLNPAGVFRFPTGTGANGRALALFDLISRSARYRNEIGLVRVDDAAGLINGVLPGQAGWVDRALGERRELLFERTRPAFATEFREIGADDFFALYIVPRGNADQARRGRRTPLFSLPAANPDGFAALRQLGADTFAFEDRGDSDFNDAVLRVGGV